MPIHIFQVINTPVCLLVVAFQRDEFNKYLIAAFTPQGGDRTPLVAPFLAAESIGNFYSPYESVHNSDDENDEQVN